jgi:hypothetical protein
VHGASDSAAVGGDSPTRQANKKQQQQQQQQRWWRRLECGERVRLTGVGTASVSVASELVERDGALCERIFVAFVFYISKYQRQWCYRACGLSARNERFVKIYMSRKKLEVRLFWFSFLTVHVSSVAIVVLFDCS